MAAPLTRRTMHEWHHPSPPHSAISSTPAARAAVQQGFLCCDLCPATNRLQVDAVAHRRGEVSHRTPRLLVAQQPGADLIVPPDEREQVEVERSADPCTRTRPLMTLRSTFCGVQKTKAAERVVQRAGEVELLRAVADEVRRHARRQRADVIRGPSTLAPPNVAISSASCAPSAHGFGPTMRCSSIACRASASRWLQSLLAEPSTPRPTRTPASRILRTGAMPEASRMFDVGQCATPLPVRAKSAISESFIQTQCACQTSSPVHPSDST